MLRAVALLVVSAGCQVALGLDRVEREVTGTWRVKYVYDNANHAPVLDTRPWLPEELTLELRSDDGEVTPIEMDYSDGSFRFVARGPDYRLFARLGDGVRRDGVFREFRHSVPHLEIQSTSLGRPLAKPAPAARRRAARSAPSGTRRVSSRPVASGRRSGSGTSGRIRSHGSQTRYSARRSTTGSTSCATRRRPMPP